MTCPSGLLAGMYLSDIEWVGDVVIRQAANSGRLPIAKSFEYGRDDPVTIAVLAAETGVKPPSQGKQGFPHPVVVLSANPPDDFIFV